MNKTDGAHQACLLCSKSIGDLDCTSGEMFKMARNNYPGSEKKAVKCTTVGGDVIDLIRLSLTKPMADLNSQRQEAKQAYARWGVAFL